MLLSEPNNIFQDEFNKILSQQPPQSDSFHHVTVLNLVKKMKKITAMFWNFRIG